MGSEQRKIRSSTLTEDDVGTIARTLPIKPGLVQSMMFSADDEPPIFDQTAPKYDQPVPGQDVMRTLQSLE